jgi:hypothetical protein
MSNHVEVEVDDVVIQPVVIMQPVGVSLGDVDSKC